MDNGDIGSNPATLAALSVAERDAVIQRALQRAREERSKAAGELFCRLAAALRIRARGSRGRQAGSTAPGTPSTA